MMLKSASLALLAAVTACNGQPAAAPAPAVEQVAHHPVSGLEVVPLTIASNGRQHTFRVEVARTSEQQARGLMERPPLGDFEGMIFPYNPPRTASFWMRNTPSPLDIIFIGADGRIINIAAETVPFSEDQVKSAAPASLVLEIRGGRAAELGIEAGDLVEW